MSMKRSKPNTRSRSGSNDNESPLFAKKPEKVWSWPEDVAPLADDVFVPYALKTKFAKGSFLSHPSFGKGVVTHVEGSRIEVLFEAGPKKLGHAG